MSNWAQAHEKKLREAFDKLRHQEALLDQLMAWLSGAEASLTSQEQVPVPDNIPIIEQLLHDHQTFEQDIQAKQPEVEEITKTGKRRKDEALPAPTSSRYGRRSTPRKP